MTARLVVLASGSGTNLQAVLDACRDGTIGAQVVAVVSDRPAALALERAGDAAVAAIALPSRDGESRGDYDRRLRDVVASYEPDWVVLAGWMRILTMSFLGGFAERVINLHPALPGEIPGTNAIERAHAEAIAGRRDHTGVMIHLVPDEGIDDGPVLATAVVPIHPGDDLATLEARVHSTEHRLLVDTLRILVRPTSADGPDPEVSRP